MAACGRFYEALRKSDNYKCVTIGFYGIKMWQLQVCKYWSLWPFTAIESEDLANESAYLQMRKFCKTGPTVSEASPGSFPPASAWRPAWRRSGGWRRSTAGGESWGTAPPGVDFMNQLRP
jgi:hypothetical protein